MNAEVVSRLQRTIDEDRMREVQKAEALQSVAEPPEGFDEFKRREHTPGTPEHAAMGRLNQWLKIGEAWAYQAFEAAELMRQGKSGLSVIPPDVADDVLKP